MTKRQEIIVRKALQNIAYYYGSVPIEAAVPLQQLAKAALEAFPDKLDLCESCASYYTCGGHSPLGSTTLCDSHKLKEYSGLYFKYKDGGHSYFNYIKYPEGLIDTGVKYLINNGMHVFSLKKEEVESWQWYAEGEEPK